MGKNLTNRDDIYSTIILADELQKETDDGMLSWKNERVVVLLDAREKSCTGPRTGYSDWKGDEKGLESFLPGTHG